MTDLSRMSKGNFLPYRRAHLIVREFKLQNRAEWRKYAREHAAELKADGIPLRPDVYYQSDDYKHQIRFTKRRAGTDADKGNQKDWVNWAVWLSARRKPSGQFVPRSEFDVWLSRQKTIRSKAAYDRWCATYPAERKQLRLPSSPQHCYAGFTWRQAFHKRAISAGNRVQEYAPFKEVRRAVRAVVRVQEMTKLTNWIAFIKEHPEWLETHRCPVSPHKVAAYANDWRGWRDFLGTDQRPTDRFKL